jgi:hypothetical protein
MTEINNLKNLFSLTLVFSLILLLLISCQTQTPSGSAADLEFTPDKSFGPFTKAVSAESYRVVLYVSKNTGSDKLGEGTRQNPYKTISHALQTISAPSPENRQVLLVAEGNYSEDPIQMHEYVDMFGGFSAATWERDIFRFVSQLNGEEKNRVIIAASNATLDGFVIRDGIFRGNGGAVLCDGTSPVISNNIFIRNKTLAPDPWTPKYWHEKAHDGGAIYGANGAAPMIEHNNFVYNHTEIGRGAAVAFQNKCKPYLAYNLFAGNSSGLKDSMRSSDGGAVSIFDWCSATIEDNLILNNRALSSNDAGGLFVALWSSADIQNNLFLDNESADDAGALFVGGQEHRYDAPLDTLPSEDQFYVTITKNRFMGNKNPSRNSGAMRFTMESRGRFRENLVVFNTGIYFQRSEVSVENNTILDNFLFVETKEGLKPGIIKDNLIWAEFTLETEVPVVNNNLKNSALYPGNYSVKPLFEDNFVEVKVFSGTFSRNTYLTDLTTSALPFSDGELVNRIIKAGNKWGVIKNNISSSLTVWGDFSGETSVTILPTYDMH